MARKTIQRNIAYDDLKKLYYVTFDYGKNEQGKRIKKTTTFKTKIESIKALKEFEADKIKGTVVQPKKITLGEWLDYWMDEIIRIKNSPTTIYGYDQIISNHIKPSLGNRPLQDIKPMEIQKYLNRIGKEKNLSPVTMNKHYGLLKTAFSYAVKQDYLYTNIIDKVEPPKTDSQEITCYNTGQIQELFRLVKDNELEICVKLAGYLGLRRGEVCGLKWENIDLDKQIVTIKETLTSAGSEIIKKGTKNKSSIRKLSLPQEICELLKEEKSRQVKNKNLLGAAYIDEDYVLVNNIGKPIRPNRLSEKFQAFIEANNLPKTTLHGLRHSFASNANSSGASIYNISKTLGHSNISTTTKVYMHLFEDVQKTTVDKVAEVYNKNRPTN